MVWAVLGETNLVDFCIHSCRSVGKKAIPWCSKKYSQALEKVKGGLIVLTLRSCDGGGRRILIGHSVNVSSNQYMGLIGGSWGRVGAGSAKLLNIAVTSLL